MNEQTTITEELQHLFKKTTDANKLFLTESAKFIKNISASNAKGADIFTTQAEVFKEAFNLFVKLNIQHTSNLIDLGVAITKRMNQQLDTGDTTGAEEDTGTKPAFVLNVAAMAGTTATTEFLLDSDKKEPVLCNLKQTEYVSQEGSAVKKSFATAFSPQSFELYAGKPQKVEIIIEVPEETREGIYLANVQVEGFEHTYFSLFINVTAPVKNDEIVTELKAPRKKPAKKK